MKTQILSFHEEAIKTAKANGWELPFALGYVSGLFDRQDGRPREHRTNEYDDYALGYHKGYSAFACPRGYGECEDNRACVYPGRCTRAL